MQEVLNQKGLLSCELGSQAARTFHLSDLPREQIFARLDHSYRAKLVAPLIETLGLVALAKLIHVGPETVRGWAEQYAILPEKRLTGYIRLDVLFDLANLARNEKFSLEEIEKHVVALKGYGCSLPAYNLHLPLMESPSMIRLLMHFMGDGFIHPVVGSDKASCYANQNDQLRNGFVGCLSELFGDVSKCVRDDVADSARLHIHVPKWIPYLLAHFYPDAVFGQLRSKLPRIVFSLPDRLQVEVVRTLADDDGSVQELCIRFVSGSSALLEDTRRLILQLIQNDPELDTSHKTALKHSVSGIKKQRNWYRLDLGFPIFEWYQHRIGFTHPDKVRELEFRIGAAKLSRHIDALARDYMVYSDLIDHEKTSQEIAFAHNLREEYVHASLRYHSTRGRVIKCGKSLKRKKAAARWRLTGLGREWVLTLRRLNTNRNKDFMRESLDHRDYLRYRYLKSPMEPGTP